MAEAATTSDATTARSMANGPAERRGWTLFVACAGVALVLASVVALNTALPDIAAATSATQTQLTWIVDSYTLLLACLLLPAGAVGDRYGRRTALLVGLGIFAVASLCPLVFNSPLQIIVARAVAGAGAAFVMPATLSLLTAAYPPQARMRAVSVWAGVASVGALFGLLGTGMLLRFWHWQVTFGALAAVGLLLFVLALTIAESRQKESPPLDVPGTVTIAAALAVLVFGILQAPEHGWTNIGVYGCLVAGVALAVVFVLIELRRHRPLLDVRLFLNPSFGTGAAAITLVFVGTFAFFFLITQFIQQVMGYSPLQTAFAVSPVAVPILTLSALSSWYLPKLGLRVVVLTSMVLIAVGFLYMRTLGVHATFIDLVGPLLVLGAGMGMATAPTTSAIMMSAPDEKQGVASAVNDVTREVGGALGIALAGSILAGSYSHAIGPALEHVPGPLRHPASASLAQALAIADRLGPRGIQLAEASKTAFVDGVNSSYLVMAAIAAVAAIIIPLFAPGRDGRRLCTARRCSAKALAGPPEKIEKGARPCR